jgi:drug/metabolite transporter (DMT)-like permease
VTAHFDVRNPLDRGEREPQYPPVPTATRSSLAWLPGFVVLSAVWGSSFALIKVALDAGVPPPWVAFARCALGALTLLTLCAVTRTPLPRDRVTWGHAAVVALLANTVPFVLLAYGEQHVDSVLAGLINATTPLMTLLFVPLLVPTEHITRRRVAGLLIGFAGVLCVIGVWRGLSGGTVTGTLACLGSTAGYGAAFAYMQRFFAGRGGSAASLSAAQLLCASAQLAVVAPVAAGLPGWPGPSAALALLALGALGTGWAYVLNLGVVRAAGPTVASTVTYVIPVWSTAIGAVLLDEPLAWNTVAGGVLVIVGVLVTRAPDRRGTVTPR